MSKLNKLERERYLLNVAYTSDQNEALEVIHSKGEFLVTEPEGSGIEEVLIPEDETDDAPESDVDVTHFDEDDDPEQHIGNPVDYDLGADSDDE